MPDINFVCVLKIVKSTDGGETKHVTVSDSTSTLHPHHNVISVLPFVYIEQGGSGDEKMSTKIQSDCFSVLKKYADQFVLQDPITTNNYL